MLSEEQLENLQKSAPKVAENIQEITQETLIALFATHPELKPIYQTFSNDYPKAFGTAIVGFSTFIEHPTMLETLVEKFKAIHLSMTKEQYTILFETFLIAMKQVLALKAPPKAIDAWQSTFAYITDTYLIQKG